MAAVRIGESNNYTAMSNYHLTDKNLSLEAKGLLSIMLYLADQDEDFSISYLASKVNANEKSIISILNELKEAGYVEEDTSTANTVDCMYIVHEIPICI